MNSKVVPLLVTLIVLVAINIAVSTYTALRAPPNAGQADPHAVDESIVSEAKVKPLSEELIAAYNANDAGSVYAMFDDLAKAQLSQDQLVEQMQKLHSVLGTVGTRAYDRAELAGTDSGRSYYNVTYKVALNGGQFAHGTLKITLLRRDNGLHLVGFFLNGSDNLIAK